MPCRTVLLIGTADTKSDELNFLRQIIEGQGASVLLMDVGVLAQGEGQVDISNAEVAAAAGSSLAALRAGADENTAMSAMARGAAALAGTLYSDGKIAAMLALGGTMGTDLAFDVASALPLGVPKVLLSTVAFSHLIPPERITPDLIMMLWAGGLYGLNSLCKSALAQAAGATVGAMMVAQPPRFDRPLVGMTSLGKSCLSYMVGLKPALEARGFEVAVFHTTGMGGRAFEALAAQGKFAAVLDLSLQELANHVGGSSITSGSTRLTGAGRSATPQIVAPGAADMIDFPAWQPVPVPLAERPVHEHNRLIASATSPVALRQAIAREVVERMAQARGPSCLLLPTKGVQAWDLPGEPLHEPQALQAMMHTLRERALQVKGTHFSWREVDAHINDQAFCTSVLDVFDGWMRDGTIKT
jgi:uncharacterized protein (UPF0261 family)